MRKKIVLCLIAVSLLVMTLPAVGMAGPAGDVNEDIECINKMVQNECPGCMSVWEKLECLRNCVKHKLEGKAACTH